ncbi:uncharacterized protein LOC108601474 [Drosophila busckii]|uniref:uncharacterized protein LOC108601474 n=1 Tax=Drosophila busckii TaxID=30019 RepID=UPI00083EF076|nr:uncharacterized protein LOC108601474 [Drosophila busckii]
MFKQRITNLQLTINVNITFENRIWQNYASKTIDVCEALNGIQDQYILQMVFMQIRRKSNIPWECPIKEHIQYYIEGVAIDTSVLPQFLPHIRFKANSDFYFNKLKMLSFKSQGQVFRN